MTIIGLILSIAALGLLVYILKRFVPMEAPAKTAIDILFVVLIVFLLLNVLFGIGPKIDILPASWQGGRR